MPLLRRTPAADPQAVARLAAILRTAGGWLPPLAPGSAAPMDLPGATVAVAGAPVELVAVPGAPVAGSDGPLAVAGAPVAVPGQAAPTPGAPRPVRGRHAVEAMRGRLPGAAAPGAEQRAAWSWARLGLAAGSQGGVGSASGSVREGWAGLVADAHGGGGPPVRDPDHAGEDDSPDTDGGQDDRAEGASGGTHQRQSVSGLPTGPVGATLLERWRQGRIDPGRRGVAAIGLVALVSALVAGMVVIRSRPHEVVPPPVVAAGVPVPGRSTAGSAASAGVATGSTAPASTAPAGPSSASSVIVSVGGRVLHPGLVRLPAGSRVDDAVRAAGGPLPGADLGTLNLARRLVDGEQVQVGAPQPAASPGAAGPAALLDLNGATLQQLDALPGIGPVLAQKVLDWRTEHGRFGSVDQLREVPGIGESKYAELKSKVSV